LCENFITTVTNDKTLRNDFNNIQTAIQGKTLKFLKYANTRKWGSTYLVLSRILRLKTPIDALLEKHKLEFVFIWTEISLSVELLLEFYVVEQMLQRVSTSVIHASILWKKCVNLVTVVSPRVSEPEELMIQLEERDSKIKSSGGFNLCLSLWPSSTVQDQEDPSFITENEASSAYHELEWLVRKQFATWVKFRKNVSLPYIFTEKDEELFVLKCKNDLTIHLGGGTIAIGNSKKMVQAENARNAKRLERFRFNKTTVNIQKNC